MAQETVRLAEYAAALRYEDLPALVVEQAKDCIIDTVAAGRRTARLFPHFATCIDIRFRRRISMQHPNQSRDRAYRGSAARDPRRRDRQRGTRRQ